MKIKAYACRHLDNLFKPQSTFVQALPTNLCILQATTCVALSEKPRYPYKTHYSKGLHQNIQEHFFYGALERSQPRYACCHTCRSSGCCVSDTVNPEKCRQTSIVVIVVSVALQRALARRHWSFAGATNFERERESHVKLGTALRSFWRSKG